MKQINWIVYIETNIKGRVLQMMGNSHFELATLATHRTNYFQGVKLLGALTLHSLPLVHFIRINIPLYRTSMNSAVTQWPTITFMIFWPFDGGHTTSVIYKIWQLAHLNNIKNWDNLPKLKGRALSFQVLLTGYHLLCFS